MIVYIDINEYDDVDTICLTTDNRECHNTNGSYSCDCIPGYVEGVPNGVCRGNYYYSRYIYLVYSNRTQVKNDNIFLLSHNFLVKATYSVPALH